MIFQLVNGQFQHYAVHGNAVSMFSLVLLWR